MMMMMMMMIAVMVVVVLIIPSFAVSIIYFPVLKNSC